MPTCTACKTRLAGAYGSGPDARADLCVGCYYDWFAVAASIAFQTPSAAPGAPPASTPADTPVWKRGLNIILHEKVCDLCHTLIHVRKRGDGRHYPAVHGSTEPHWRACNAKRRAAR